MEYDAVAKAKTSMPVFNMLSLGFLAGMFIAFGAVGSQFAGNYVNPLAGAFVFPVGLTCVVIAGTELFTGNCLLVLPLLRKEVTFGKVLLSWIMVYTGNALGGIVTAILIHTSGVLPEEIRETAAKTCETKCALPYAEMFVRAILCNILVCTAVWLAMSAKDTAGKIIGLYLPTMLFVLCKFEHSIANWYFLPVGSLSAGGAVVTPGMAASFIFVTIGNILGGAFLAWVLFIKNIKKD